YEMKGGVLKEKNKYLSPPGRSNLFYIPPGTPAEYLTDVSIKVAFTEGEKKALALFRYFSERAERVLVIGLCGVWGWRGRVGKAVDDVGARCDVKGPINDFDRITWQGRHAYIIYDTNVHTNDSVKAARNGLAKEIKGRGVDVRLVDLPEIDGVNGVDDLLALKGPDYLTLLISDAKKSEKPERKSQATILVELAQDAELFHTEDFKPFATITVGSHRETWPLDSRGFRDYIARLFYDSQDSAPSSQAIQEAIGVLQGVARFKGEMRDVYTRLAEHEGAIYLDLCDENWRVVQITRDGWKVADESPVKFRRTRGMLPLPEPTRGNGLSLLRSLVNVTDHDWPLVLAWLVTTFRPNRPFPVLALHGEQGSAKSTAARILRALVDPNKAALRSEPRDERDLMIAATNGWLVALDNLSRVQTWLSDGLCRLATGGGFATRELYANDEEVLFDAMRPVLLNGIEELATRSDLLDRAIILNLPTITEDRRRSERDVWGEFEQARPAILGALLDAVSHALRNLENVRIERLPRMADFALWATAAEEALGLPLGAFMAAYTGNREAANDLALEASPVVPAVIAFVEREKLWTGSATELLKELNALAGDEAQKQQGWPKRGNILSGILRRLAPNLRNAGVGFSRLNRSGHKGSRQIQLEQTCILSSASSASSARVKTSMNSQDFADDSQIADDHADNQSSAENSDKSGFADNLTIADDCLQPHSGVIDPDILAERAAFIAESCNVSDAEARQMALNELAQQTDRVFDAEGNEYHF
ncbi:MAG TPA: DUF3854 domain-containing protein, partial [Pyrinomonadaceae bacterium]|nr:DUF3854 domain-containing protein [Pyrinomonadaceae bacterium]